MHKLRDDPNYSPTAKTPVNRKATSVAQAESHPASTAPYNAAKSVEGDIRVLEVSQGQSHSAHWLYHDKAGAVVGAAVRFDDEDGGKRVLPLTWNSRGKAVTKAMPAPRPMYDLPQLVSLAPGSLVFVTEGEKCAEAVKQLGLVATTSNGGCKAAGKTDWSALAGREVVVLPDNDKPGEEYAAEVLSLLNQLDPTPSLKLVQLPGLEEKEDVADWLVRGGTKQQLLKIVEKTEAWRPKLEPWPEIEPLEHVPLPPFPTAVLPSPLRKWVEAESISTQTPPDLAAMLSLAVSASAIARKFDVEPRKGWIEPTNIYTTTVLEPANRKSTVFSDATRPLRELELEEADLARGEVAQEQLERRQAQGRLSKLEKDLLKNSTESAKEEAKELAKKLADWPEPSLPRRLVDDATSEKLGMLLAEQGGRIASMSPEGGVFDLMAGLYSKSGMPQFDTYLKGHSGDDLRTDRVGRQGIYVERPAISIAYAIQPAVIEGLAEQSAFRGRGLLARFLYASPASWIGTRQIPAPPMPDIVAEGYREMIYMLGRTQLEGTLRPTAEAASAIEDWERKIEQMLGDGGQMEIMQDWGGKLAGTTWRLAAIIHCIEYAHDNPLNHEIELEAVQAAIEIAKYLIPHAEFVLTKMSSGDSDDDGLSVYLLKWIERKQKSRFTRRDAHQENSKLKKRGVEEIDPLLQDLEQRGYIRKLPGKAKGPGRPPSPEFEVNPALLYGDSSKRDAQNTHKGDKSRAELLNEGSEINQRVSKNGESVDEGRECFEV